MLNHIVKLLKNVTMSKGNIIQGQASGKLGDTVLMVRNGQQLARVYTKAGARSGSDASEAARIQRVKFGASSNQWSLYKYVCTRMFRKGRKSNQSDYNYFVKKNSTLLPYLTKAENADGVHVLMPGQFSEGNLGRIELVHSSKPSATGSNPLVSVSDLNSTSTSQVHTQASLSALKASLAGRFPNARKVTYLLSIPSEVQIEEEGVSFVSQYITHNTVIIDLYNEIEPGENSVKVNAYFANHVSDMKLKAAFSAQGSHIFLNSHFLLQMFADEGVDANFVANLGILVFATNDIASDCYTSILQDTSIPSTVGAYALWAGYRTQSSLRVAADSYGYQSGVMRDDIAAVGDDLSTQMVQYIAKIRAIDPEMAASLEKELNAGNTAARTVRKVVAPSESEK